MSPQKTSHYKLSAPPMVYISGEEMTRVVMQLVLDKWIAPYLDTKQWQMFDLSCKHRDDTGDKVLDDAVKAGAQVGAIFKEPTITATAEQAKAMGLSAPQGSPNGVMRRGWNGYSIDRDTIKVAGLEKMMGYEKPVLFCRHAVGGEYGAGYQIVGKGKVKTIFTDEHGHEHIIDERQLKDEKNAAVFYHNPLDNVERLAHHFFVRALAAEVTPYVVTKKTVFKWQEPFWHTMKEVFDSDYKEFFAAKGLLKSSGGELRHLLSDDAAMKLVYWKTGGFAMVAHNYDGDWLTDELAAMYKSPGFISSVLTGVTASGQKIMEFEASHGTIADQYKNHVEGKETSVNPLGLVHALRGAIDHSAALAAENRLISTTDADKIKEFTGAMYDAMCEAMADGRATRDLAGSSGLSTGGFIDEVAGRLEEKMLANSASGKKKLA
jgi:isocitrate dehydrogenase